MWGLSPQDGDAAINAYKLAQGITNPCAGTDGGGPDAIDVVIEGQNFLGYPTYCVVCPDKSMYFDVCWPPSSATCFDPYIEDCASLSLTANFTSDVTEVCENGSVYFTDLSVGAVDSWNWTFEGGDPATSTEQNPVVTYFEEGTYDVSLEVTSGTMVNTMTMEGLIDVLASPPVMLLPFDDVCITDPPFELTGGSPAGGVYSGPGIEDGLFDPAAAGLGLHTITYTYAAMNGCENTAEETLLVDECTGLDPVGESGIKVYPTASDGIFTLETRVEGNARISTLNLLGTIVNKSEITGNGQIKTRIDLTGMPKGTYFIVFSDRNRTETIKVLLH